MFDARAPIYEQDGKDGSSDFHTAECMSLLPGLKVLDLGCGTGGITIPAARAIGPSGTVIGLDISPVSLDIARSKAKKQNLAVTFLEHNFSNLSLLDSIEEGTFDFIACASAMVLLKYPAACVKHWATLLKKRKKLIFDTSTHDSSVIGRFSDTVKQELNMSTVYGSKTVLGTIPKVKQMLVEAGLDATETFVSRQYDEFKGVEEIEAAKREEYFESTM